MERFLAETSLVQLATIPADRAPAWGRMSVHQMLEHLVLSQRLSLGQLRLEVVTPAKRLPGLVRWLHTDEPMPEEVVLPGFEELPALVHPTPAAALEELTDLTHRFLAREAELDPPPAHPVFGPLEHEGWMHFHVKHVKHHLRQFGAG